FNSDQGSQFTSDPFTDILITRDITISMDGKGAWRDNVFVERFWRTLKYEEVYLKAYESVAQARSSIGCYLEFYNTRRPHSALDRRTPDQAYYASLPPLHGSIRALPNPGQEFHLSTQRFCSKNRSHLKLLLAHHCSLNAAPRAFLSPRCDPERRGR